MTEQLYRRLKPGEKIDEHIDEVVLHDAKAVAAFRPVTFMTSVHDVSLAEEDETALWEAAQEADCEAAIPDHPANALMKRFHDYFRKLRFDDKHHLGLGDIRLTLDQQEELYQMAKAGGRPE